MSVHHPVVCHMNGCSDAQIALSTWQSPKFSSWSNRFGNDSLYQTPRASSRHLRKCSEAGDSCGSQRVTKKVQSIEEKICDNFRAAADFGKKMINSYISSVSGGSDYGSKESDISNHEKLMAKKRGNTHAMSRKLRKQMITDNERNRHKERVTKSTLYCNTPGCSCGGFKWEDLRSAQTQPAPSSARTRSTVSDGDYCVHQNQRTRLAWKYIFL
ncbi:Oidioi.mRNA.OKI2018_I69.chr2.g7183.t1.cds [Oikopleura dioica]|uniref:Oidioi.mRNA.OKI2018_I69.chr2.g7183.t1.cds n=1 Tax=Oikopleura dioica TaxID=34765 RepID=A0ABN7T5B8_OIKDI|nr:Oidioi.mRNA.OKI2018_I69.chr2.g7183.t1.cds [Oikopleura dioica]